MRVRPAGKRTSARWSGPAGGRAGRRLALLCLLALAAVAAYLLRAPLLARLGGLLVAADPLEKADAALVLGGDDSYDGSRVRAAVSLYRDGWVRKLVLSGPRQAYGIYETEISVPLAVSWGVPRADILPVPSGTRSTEEEARLILPLLERKGIRSLYLVTGSFHTRRTRRIFLRACNGRMRLLAFPAPSPWFDPQRWWESREGRKTFLLEALKNIASIFY
mgnify:CR=1 FL=1